MLGRRLHAEADPGEAGLAQAGQRGRASPTRGWPRSSPRRRRRPGRARGPRRGRRRGRRPAAASACRRRRRPWRRSAGRGRGSGGPAQLGDRRPGVLGAVGAGAELVGGVGVEVAVAAAGRAERDVHVEAERRRRQARAGALGQPVGAEGPGAAGRGVEQRQDGVHLLPVCRAGATARQDARGGLTDRGAAGRRSRAGSRRSPSTPPPTATPCPARCAPAADGADRRPGRRRRPGGRARPHRPGLLLGDGPVRGRRRRGAGPGRARVPRAAGARSGPRPSRSSRSSAARRGPAGSACWPPATSSSPATSATFAFSEVRLGIVPAVISAVVLPRMVPHVAHRLMLTGQVFDAETRGDGRAGRPRRARRRRGRRGPRPAGPPDRRRARRARRDQAAAARADADRWTSTTLLELSARFFASEEGQEGIAAFREKRPAGGSRRADPAPPPAAPPPAPCA